MEGMTTAGDREQGEHISSVQFGGSFSDFVVFRNSNFLKSPFHTSKWNLKNHFVKEGNEYEV